ncbi:MAG: 5-oxoprolinase subunit PxpB [Patiriisocius sp.]|uniref:5-oxoprolinase subunit PxpB n=1 Tax=Patiriisocius sp. TaxID=2822396 RepID=UPI003EF96104
MKYPILKPYGLHAILLEWEQKIAPEIHKEVIKFQNLITMNFSDEIVELVPAYNSLAVYLQKSTKLENFVECLKSIEINASEISNNERHVVHIPVCYEPTFGIDISEVAKLKNLSIPEIIRLHTQQTYPVYFLGFLPGFPYLGGLDERLCIKRKKEPRAQIPSGSVAISGNQTGIYPSDSPGGWNIIGRTPLDLFSVVDATCLLKAGDSVKFYEISEEEFNQIKGQIEAENYVLRREVIDG